MVTSEQPNLLLRSATRTRPFSRVECGGKERSYQWEEIGRAVVTPKTIGIYYGKEQAMILPKQDFG